jgi:hypothetical protein
MTMARSRRGSGANPHAYLATFDASGLEAGARSPWSTSALGPADRVTGAPASSGTSGSELTVMGGGRAKQQALLSLASLPWPGNSHRLGMDM